VAIVDPEEYHEISQDSDSSPAVNCIVPTVICSAITAVVAINYV